MLIKKAKKKNGDEEEENVTIHYQPLNPEQVYTMAEDFKHPRDMGMGAFLTQLTHKIDLYNFHPLKTHHITCAEANE